MFVTCSQHNVFIIVLLVWSHQLPAVTSSAETGAPVAIHDMHYFDMLKMDVFTPKGFGISFLITCVLVGIAILTARGLSKMSVGSTGEWSIPTIFALTSYRFHTGFLSATWMPYVLAMEGEELCADRQSMFMGTTKLIFGLSVLLNPFLGLVGDQLTSSHWTGRRAFLVVGVIIASLGIGCCIAAAKAKSVPTYLVGAAIWMLGEAVADVTSESLVPDFLPRSQYDTSSSIRALNFLLGGLFGYTLLIIFNTWRHSWLYYGYLSVMATCAVLSVGFISEGGEEQEGELMPRPIAIPRPVERPVERPVGWRRSCFHVLYQAYVQPSQYKGGFPRACLALLIFSFGSAPMFFLMLMVRDLEGVTVPDTLQIHFSLISMTFFISAAIVSVVGNKGPTDAEKEAAQLAQAQQNLEIYGCAQESCVVPSRPLRMMFISTIAFGIFASMIPFTSLLPSMAWRVTGLYFVASLFGGSFGSVYARYQECTWNLLPPHVDVANAMGYSAMCKLLGLGIGNFLAGTILSCFAREDHRGYTPAGYFVMCSICSGFVFVSGGIIKTISQTSTVSTK